MTDLKTELTDARYAGMTDDRGGTAPRADAPELTGLVLKQLRDFSASMSAIVTPAAKTTLISKMVRSLGVVLKV